MNLHPYKDPGPHGAHALLPNINIILHHDTKLPWSSGSEITWRWRVIELSSIGIHQQGPIYQCWDVSREKPEWRNFQAITLMR